eukprot:CAMPEP_0183307202 /NCGR_PEP_ID=MMETSP0160_2-20130417/16959_1 /TAXON_ID=2839 ORGANISM="Odontella Sinensis, Strain Grunow 1884" /NCGR_SAMPLE_ID=MMETSP0160_2 /ASSEMBLY_ACC=CAM_ASM_000250 /LENGTH=125 /DNA_ID=CAMNT_0025470747 /DNA_START=75 /DNA_END=449 /DNA_ORIENTATION=-
MRFSSLSLLLPLLRSTLGQEEGDARAATTAATAKIQLRGSPRSVNNSRSYTLAAPLENKCNGLSPKSVCASAKDEDGAGCWWCDAAAVPSGCYSKEQAEALPPGVFVCAGPGGEEEEEEEEEDAE